MIIRWIKERKESSWRGWPMRCASTSRRTSCSRWSGMTLMMIIMVKRRVMVMIEEGDHYCDGEFTEIVANGRSADVFGNNWDAESFYYVVTRKTQRVYWAPNQRWWWWWFSFLYVQEDTERSQLKMRIKIIDTMLCQWHNMPCSGRRWEVTEVPVEGTKCGDEISCWETENRPRREGEKTEGENWKIENEIYMKMRTEGED